MIEFGGYIWYYELIFMLLTLIATIVSIYLYYKALKLSGEQVSQVNKSNQVLLSQNIKPDFDREIDVLKEQGKTININHWSELEGKNITYNFKDILQKLLENFMAIEEKNRYSDKLPEFKRIIKTVDDFSKLEFYNELMYLHNVLDFYFPLYNYFAKIREMVRRIRSSEMIEEHKHFTKINLEREVLGANILYSRIILKNFGNVEYPIFNISSNKMQWIKVKDFKLMLLLEDLNNDLERPEIFSKNGKVLRKKASV